MKRRLQFLSLAALALGAAVVVAPTASAQDAGTADLVIVHGLRHFRADLDVDGKLLIDTFRPQANGLQFAPTKVATGDGSVTQTPTESNGTTGEAIGLGAVALFFAVATIRRLRRTA